MDEIDALKRQVAELRAELVKTQAQAREQRESFNQLLAEREVSESPKKSERKRGNRERGAFDSASGIDSQRAPRNRSGSSSRRRHWNRVTDRVLRSIAIGAFVLAVCGILGTVIYSFSASDSQSEIEISQPE
ncbi:MAG: hypothetical protein O3C28_01325 [Proteobacteria bacterium]|nr:hypothetical protein [Pseudomonadota bacterium]